MRILIAAGVVGVSLSFAFAGEAQQSPTSNAQPPAASHSSPSQTTVHLEGCVFPKQALSSPKPVIIPFGTTQDYVLTDIKIIAAADGSNVTNGEIFKVDQVPQNRLRELAGQRVGVTGRVDGKGELPPLEVTSIREIAGTCPVVPTHS